MSAPLATQAVRLATARFAGNLAFAFVGGSRARGTQTVGSDIDVVVVIHHSDRRAERRFAEELRALHQRAGLLFDHCGEVFDVSTLDELLTFTERAIAAAPALQRAACYQADCPLSIFRKGDVAFRFLADPKIDVYDPQGRLDGLRQRAVAYFQRWPAPRIQAHKTRLELPPASPQARLAERWQRRAASHDWFDTPVGIGLQRWFGRGLRSRACDLLPAPADTAPAAPWTCPLPRLGDAGRSFVAQCLAYRPSCGPEAT